MKLHKRKLLQIFQIPTSPTDSLIQQIDDCNRCVQIDLTDSWTKKNKMDYIELLLIFKLISPISLFIE